MKILPGWRVVAAAAVALLAVASAGCQGTDLVHARAKRAVLERQVEALEHQIAQGRGSRVVAFEQCLIAIDQGVLRDLLAAALPYETQSGPFRVRLTDASVECEDGFALVRMRGHASLAGQPDSNAFADATIYAALRTFTLEHDTGELRGHLDVIAVDVGRVMRGGLRDESMRGLLSDIGRLETEVFQGRDYSFGIPVRLGRDVLLPEVRTRRIRTHPATLPLEVAVTGVSATNGRLWIGFRLDGEPLANVRRGDDGATAASVP